jgi:integrase
MNESSLHQVPPVAGRPERATPRRRAARRRGVHSRDGRVTFEDRTRRGLDGKRVKYRVWGYTLGSGSTRKKVYREEWTEQDADDALRDAREARAMGNLVRPTERTFAQVIEEYLVFKRGGPGDEGKATVDDDATVLKNRILRRIGNVPIRALTETVIARYTKERTNQVRANTIRNELSILRHLLRLAKKWGYLPTVPDIALPEAGASRERHLMAEEIPRLLAACEQSRNRDLATMVALALNTGYRRGKLLGLKWEHIDFSTARITVPRRKSPKRRQRTPHSIPISPAVYDILIRHAPTAAQRTGFVFARGRTGQAPSIRRAYEAAVARAGLTDFTFHDLRHTTASQLILAGATLQEVKEILGHSDIKLTLRYAHLNPAQLRTAVARLDFRLPAGESTPNLSNWSDKWSDEGGSVDTRVLTPQNHCTPP